MPVKSLQHLYLLLIPVTIALLVSMGLVAPVLAARTTLVLIIFLCIILYALSCLLSGQVKDGLWTGYNNLAAGSAWLIINPGAAIVVIGLGAAIGHTFLAHFHRQESNEHYPVLSEWIKRVVISGTGILVATLVYQGMGGTFPVQSLHGGNLRQLIPALLMGMLSIQGCGMLLTGNSIKEQSHLLYQHLSTESLLFALLLIQPLIFYEIGIGAFIVIMALSALQTVHRYQINHSNQILTQRIRELSVLNKLGQAVARNIKLNDVLQSIYEEIDSLMPSTDFIIALYNEKNNTVSYPMVMRHGKQHHRATRPLSHGLTDAVIRGNRALKISHNDAATHPDINILEVDSAAYMGVPLTEGERVIGVIALAHQTNADAFSDSDLSVLQSIAGQVSLTIRNAQLYDTSTRMTDNLRQVNDSIQEVMFNLDKDDALHQACLLAIRLIRAQKAAIFIQDKAERHLVKLVQSEGFNGSVNTPVLEAPYRPERYDQGGIMVSSIADSDDETLRKQAEAGNFQATMEVPLRAGTLISGYLAVYHDDVYYYDMPEMSLLMMLSNQVTAALDNAELLHTLELYASEQAQLVHLSRISGATLDLEQIILDVSQILCQMLLLDQTQIILIPPDRDLLRLYSPQDNHSLRQAEIPLDAIPELHQLLSKNGTQIQRYHLDENVSAELQDFMQTHLYHSLAIVPMRLNQDLVGFIMPGSREPYDFAQHQHRLIEMASNQITAQIQNARIHTLTEEALIQRLEQLTLIESIASQISQSLNPDTIIQSVLHAALQSTVSDRVRLILLEAGGAYRVIEQSREGAVVTYSQITTGQDIIERILQSRTLIIEPDITRLPDYEAPAAPETDVYPSLLAVPLMQGEDIVGILSVESLFANFYTSEQAGFIRNLAGHAAISLYNAHLLNEHQTQIETLTYLRELTLEAATGEERGRVIAAILGTALEILGGKESILYACHSGEIVPIGGMKQSDRTLYSADPILPYYLIEKVMRTHTRELIEDISDSPYYNDEDLSDYDSLLVIPIIRGGAVTEILGLTFDTLPTMHNSYQNTIELFSAQAAGHLENIFLNEALRANYNQMRTILDTTRDGILLLDRHGRIKAANIAIEKFLMVDLRNHLEQRMEQVIIQHFGDADDNHNARELLHIATDYWQESDETMQREYALRHDELMIYIREVAVPVLDKGGQVTGRLYSLRDITEEKEIAEYRQKIQGMVLHDLQSPLSSMITSLDLAISMMKKVEPDNIDQIMSIQKISIESARSLFDLVETMRDIPRLNKGEMPIEHLYLPLEDLVEDAYYTLISSLQQSKIQFEIRLEDSIGSVYVDRKLIRRVFVNLIHNAYKFTPPDGKILVISDDTALAEGFIRVRVCDSGPGIPADMRERIFNEFEQVKNHKPYQGGKGTGLGLNFCKLAVEAHGGHIMVAESGPLSGACFLFTLPIPEDSYPITQSSHR